MASDGDFKEKAVEIVEKVGRQIRTGSKVLAENVRKGSRIAADSINEMRVNTPRYKEQAIEIYLELRDPALLRLRGPNESLSLSQFVKDHEAVTIQLKNLSTPAAVALSVLSLRALSTLGHLTDVYLSQLLHTPTRTARVALAATVAPGYLLAYKFEHELLKEQGRDSSEWHSAVLVRNYRRLPPAFYLAASASCTVTAKAIFAAIDAIILRLFNVRVITIAALAGLYWLVKRDGKRKVAATLVELKGKFPPRAAEYLDKVLEQLQESWKLANAKLEPLIVAAADHMEPLKKMAIVPKADK